MKYNAKEFTNEEKILLIQGKNDWETNDLNGKLPKVVMSDGPCGIRTNADVTVHGDPHRLPSVAYPSGQCLAQTWDEDLAYQEGKALANDAIEKNIDIILGPSANIKRSPLCGRNFEYFSEDPLLAGIIAKNYISGIQDQHVGTSLKHFCCNNLEFARFYSSSEVDERTLREIYLKVFEIACQAKPWTVMCSYNLVNGVRMSEHGKLFNYLRNDTEFAGTIISDWGAVRNPLASLLAGLDLEMPYEEKHALTRKELLVKNQIDLDKLNESAQRVLDLISKNEEEKGFRNINLTLDERIAISQKIAEDGIVLAKNNGVLPLKPGTSIVVDGNSSRYYVFGGGSGEVTPNKEFVRLEKALINEGYDAVNGDCINCHMCMTIMVDNITKLNLEAARRDVLIFCVGDEQFNETESRDRPSLELPGEQVEIIKMMRKVAKKIVLVVHSGAPMNLTPIVDDVDAILLCGFGGQNSTTALARVLTGTVNPSGKTSETWAYNLTDYSCYDSYRDAAVQCYEEGLNVGYRHFVTNNIKALFPFGYGLSYSQFEYINMRIIKIDTAKFLVEVDVENISDVDGKEVVQLYISELTKTVYRPLRELKAFKKVLIKAHHRETISFELTSKELQFYSVTYDRWMHNPGIYEIQIGRGADDIVLQERITVE